MDPMGRKDSSSPADPKDNAMSGRHKAARDLVKGLPTLKAKLMAAAALNPKHADEHIKRIAKDDKYNGPHAKAHIEAIVPNAKKLSSLLHDELKKAGAR